MLLLDEGSKLLEMLNSRELLKTALLEGFNHDTTITEKLRGMKSRASKGEGFTRKTSLLII
jgi:hypothetical protein